uniref:Uncharacterized protein n=1 Tax=Plectus sambesii TaxID=2011161 RepID=A0A914WCX8_9BILA
MLIGTSFYNLVHPEDLLVLVKSLKELFKKMQCTTPYYRLMGGSDIVVWVQTEAGVVSRNSRGQHGKFVFCIHQILGSQNGAQPNSISMDAEELSVAPVTSYTMVKDLNVDSPMAFAVDSPMAYEEVLQWLISDLPESPLPDPDATPALAANAYSSKQQRELLECTNATSIVSPPEADAVELPSVNFGMENGQLQDCKGNDVSNIQFEHLAISSSSQHLLDDGSCHENNANLYPQFSTVLPTAESLSYDDTTECLETLAPFVAQEEILPLDMQGLLADLNMDAWFQSELEMYKVENNRPLETPPPPANSNRIKNSTFEIINM